MTTTCWCTGSRPARTTSCRRSATNWCAIEPVPLGEGSATLLLSAEEISTRICNPDPWAGFDDGRYWDQRRRFLARLRGVLPEGASVETFVCFRDPEAYAHSLYATKLLSGKFDWSFVEFVRRCAPIFDYGRQVDVLAEGLGPVRVQELRASAQRPGEPGLRLAGRADPG